MRKLCWFAIPCSGAVFLAVCLLPEGWLLAAGFFCALLMVSSLLLRGNSRRRAALILMGAAFGFLWTGGYNALFRTPAHALVDGGASEFTLTVTDYPIPSTYGVSLPVRISLPDAPAPKAVVYMDDSAIDLRPGDVLSAVVRWSSTDFRQGVSSSYEPSRGIFLVGYIDTFSLSVRPQRIPLRFLPQAAARSWKLSIAAHCPDDVSGFISALVTGDKGCLPDGLYAAFRRAGLAHVVAVSGLHVGFLAGLLTTLLGKRKRCSAAVGMTLIFFFAAAAGNSLSVLRAAFMEGFLLLAPLLGREEDKPTALSAVLLLLLLQCPYAAASVGLQLSFGAVAGIYLITGPLYARWMKFLPKKGASLWPLLRAAGAFVFGSLATTLGALLFTTPMTAWYFRSVSLAGPLTNLLTLWAVSATFLGGLLTALAGPVFPILSSLLGYLLAWPSRWVLWVARAIARRPFAALSLTTVYLAGWFVLTYVVLLLLFSSKRRPRPAIPMGAAAVVTLCAALLMSTWPSLSARLTVTVLDVGQGSSALFFSRGRAVLVDCGGNSADDPGDLAADTLQSLGLSHLDALVLTHFHSDHACGVPELLARVDVSTLLLPDVEPEDPLRKEITALAESSGCEVKYLSDDAELTFGDAAMTLYAPLGDGGANEEGLAARCTVGDFDVLVTGDLNDVVERRLIKYKNLPDIELLVVGHHGAKNATSEDLLLATRPETAVVSSGYNRYGHPSAETLERLGAAGCDIYRTDGMGNITFTLK